MAKPILVFGYGNLSRGDDALGPLLLEYVQQNVSLQNIEILSDFQLQVEHALDLQERELVLFVDASVTNDEAYDFFQLQPCRDKSYTTHVMSPAAVLQVYRLITAQPPPPAFLLSIQGASFELGADLSVVARDNLTKACGFAAKLLQQADLSSWLQQVENARNISA